MIDVDLAKATPASTAWLNLRCVAYVRVVPSAFMRDNRSDCKWVQTVLRSTIDDKLCVFDAWTVEHI